MIIYQCDRCADKISSDDEVTKFSLQSYHYSFGEFVKTIGSLDIKYDLCEKCAEAIRNFIDDYK